MLLLGVISADAVKERDYFLSFMNDPLIVNGIRILAAAVFVAFIVVYVKYKKK